MSTSSTDQKSSAIKETVVGEARDGYDIESGSAGRTGEQLKRDLASRHINMIAIAGMIVSHSQPKIHLE